MPSLANASRISSLNRGNLIAALLVCLLVFAFFLLPEIITPSSESDSSVVSEVEPVSDDEMETVVAREDIGPKEVQGKDLSPLALISASLDRSELPLKSMAEAHRDSKGARASLGELPSAKFVGEEKAKEPGEILIPSTGDLKWRDILKPKIVKALREASKQSGLLVREIPQKYKLSRYNLISFMDGINVVLNNGKDGLVKPNLVLEYLDHLDQAVTKSMVREELERLYYLRWADISLGPSLQSSRALAAKMRAVSRFNPQLTLTFIHGSQHGKVKGGRDPEAPLKIRLKGFAVGADLKRLYLYANGNDSSLRKIPIKRKPDHKGRRFFQINKLPNALDSLFTLRAVDVQGNIYEKHYRFHPQILRFPWRHRTTWPTFSFPFRKVDPRVDAVFRVGASGQALPGRGGHQRKSPIQRF